MNRRLVLASVALVVLAGCGGGDAEPASEAPVPTDEQTTEAEAPAPEMESTEAAFEPDYPRVSDEMARYYPGEGWDDLETTTQAADAACDHLGLGKSLTEISSEWADDGIDATQAIALIGYASDLVCPDAS